MKLRVLYGIAAALLALAAGPATADDAPALSPANPASPGALGSQPADADPLLLNEPLLVDPAPPEPPAPRPLSEARAEAGPAGSGTGAVIAPAAENPYATIVWDESPAAAHAAPTGAATEVGEASWYGPKFHGRRTASGEIYDMHASTVAHPSWPLGSVVRVRSLTTGRTTLARVNDRGPYARGRILDCSYAVAEMLGFLHAGTADVEITLLDADADAWKRFDVKLAPRAPKKRMGPPAPSEFTEALAAADEALVLAAAEDAAPPVPDVMQTGATTPDRSAVLRTASVVPFPAIVHAWQGVYRWFAGTPARPGEWPGIERRLDRFGLRGLLAWFMPTSL